MLEEGYLSAREARVAAYLNDHGPSYTEEVAKSLKISSENAAGALGALKLYGVVSATQVPTTHKKKYKANKRVDIDKLQLVKNEQQFKERNRRRKKQGRITTPTKEEMEMASRELDLADQYFIRKALMKKIAYWLRKGAPR